MTQKNHPEESEKKHLEKCSCQDSDSEKSSSQVSSEDSLQNLLCKQNKLKHDIDKIANDEECSCLNSETEKSSSSTESDESVQPHVRFIGHIQTKPIDLSSQPQIIQKNPPEMEPNKRAINSEIQVKGDDTSVSSTSYEPLLSQKKDRSVQVRIYRKKVLPEMTKPNIENEIVKPVLQHPLPAFLKEKPDVSDVVTGMDSIEMILIKDSSTDISPKQSENGNTYNSTIGNAGEMMKEKGSTASIDPQVDILLKSLILEGCVSKISSQSTLDVEDIQERFTSRSDLANSVLRILQNSPIPDKCDETEGNVKDSLEIGIKDSSTSMTFTPEQKPSQELLTVLAEEGKQIEQRRKVIVTAPDGPLLDWKDFYPLSTIYAHMANLEYLHPSLCTTFDIGKTYEGRALKLMKISNSKSTNVSVWMDAGIHAREWIAPAVATYVMHHITTNFDNMESFMTNKDWYILPVMNPDGYEYSHTTNRLWRKNRSVINGRPVGVDLNRNFSVGWGKKDSSNSPESISYRGPQPFSEAESSAVRNMLQKSGIQFQVYLTLHCYAQVILFPYSHTEDPSPDYNRLLEGATIMSRAIFNSSGTVYKVGTSKELLKGASGTSTDWSYDEAKIPYCYTLELRGKRNRSFTQAFVERTIIQN